MCEELLVRAMLQINKQNADITRLSFKNSNYNEYEEPETDSVKVSNLYISSSPPGYTEHCTCWHVSIHVQLIKISEEKKKSLSFLTFWSSSGLPRALGSKRSEGWLSCGIYSWVTGAGGTKVLWFFRNKRNWWNHWCVAAISNLVSSHCAQVPIWPTYWVLALKIPPLIFTGDGIPESHTRLWSAPLTGSMNGLIKYAFSVLEAHQSS